MDVVVRALDGRRMTARVARDITVAELKSCIQVLPTPHLVTPRTSVEAFAAARPLGTLVGPTQAVHGKSTGSQWRKWRQRCIFLCCFCSCMIVLSLCKQAASLAVHFNSHDHVLLQVVAVLCTPCPRQCCPQHCQSACAPFACARLFDWPHSHVLFAPEACALMHTVCEHAGRRGHCRGRCTRCRCRSSSAHIACGLPRER